MDSTNTRPLPGNIIKKRLAYKMMGKYVDRIQDTKEAFDKIPEIERPFKPYDEALGWVFHRTYVERVIHDLGTNDEFVVIAFGVGPVKQDDNGDPIGDSPDVVHCIVTPAHYTGDSNTYQFSKLVAESADDSVFGAEQGNTCCHGLLPDCAHQILTTGTFQMFL